MSLDIENNRFLTALVKPHFLMSWLQWKKKITPVEVLLFPTEHTPEPNGLLIHHACSPEERTVTLEPRNVWPGPSAFMVTWDGSEWFSVRINPQAMKAWYHLY